MLHVPCFDLSIMVSSTISSRGHRESILDAEITETLIFDSVDVYPEDASEIDHPGSGINWNFGIDLDTLDDMERLIWALEGDDSGIVNDNRHYDSDFLLSIDDLSGPPQTWSEEASASYPNADDDIVADLARDIGLSLDVENDLGPNIHDRGRHINDLGPNILDLALHNNDLGTDIHDLGLPINDLSSNIHDLGLHINDMGPHIREGSLNDSLDGPVEADAILGELADHVIFLGQSGNRPASKFAVDSLVEVVELKQKENCEGVLCAVCKEELNFWLLEQQLRKLPCSHFFHGDCILPWLRIRNTCPVCRYELPTDI